MTQGLSTNLNLMLNRLSSIESNFRSLEVMAGNNIQNTQELSPIESDFKAILDKKINENIEQALDNAPLDEDLDIDLKDSINLKSKIDLKAQSSNVDELIETFSNKYGVDGDFIKAIIKQESGFNPKATSKKGAMGLMQLMPATAKGLGVKNAYNESENIEGGVKLISNLLKTYNNNTELALAAYNAGPGAVKKYGGIPPYKETQNYVKNIMANYNKVKGAQL